MEETLEGRVRRAAFSIAAILSELAVSELAVRPLSATEYA